MDSSIARRAGASSATHEAMKPPPANWLAPVPSGYPPPNMVPVLWFSCLGVFRHDGVCLVP